MAQGPSFFFFMLFLCNTVTSSDIPLPHTKRYEVIWEKKQLFPSFQRELIEHFHNRITQHDSVDPPTTPISSPSPLITNPVTNPAPGIVTVPGTNPMNPPVTNPVNPLFTNPISPPVTNPVSPSIINPVSPPVTNPVSPSITNPISPPVTNPVSPPVTNPTNPPVPVTNPSTTLTGSGRWCITKIGASQAALQAALDYACGTGGADCASIQQGSSCYEPATLQNHASYAFNSYYQKNLSPTSCDFGGAAVVTPINPSTGSCVYLSSSTAAAPPTTQTLVNPTSLPNAPPKSSGPGTQYPPPPGFSIGGPDPTGLGAFGASPPLVNTPTPSASNSLRPFMGYLLTTTFIIMFGL